MSVFGPRERIDWTISFNAEDIGDVTEYLTQAESRYDDIIPGAEKEVIWFDQPGAKTRYAVIYIHGFSATKQEIRPVPDNLATEIGANLYFTRLTGHGRGAEAMGQATVNDWLNDMAEAIAIGEAIGEEVIVVSTSTGGTISAIAAVDPDQMKNVAGIAFVSPNFAINSPVAGILTAPFGEVVLPLIFGKRRSFEPLNEGQAKWWTTEYPSSAVFPLAAAVATAVGLPYQEAVFTPAFFAYSPEDTVVRAEATRKIAEIWPAQKEIWEMAPLEGDDPAAHVIAGDIMSPGRTDEMVARLVAWVGTLTTE